MSAGKNHQLAEFIIDKAFAPVMRARPDSWPEADRKTLQHVQDATRAEIERYRRYRSVKEVVINFKRDLTSKPAKKIHAQLRRLQLPTIEDIKAEFESKAREFGS